MPVIGKSLTDTLKQILQSLQVSFIFPAAVFVITSLLLYPGEIEADDSTHAVFVIAATILVSYLLYACNVPIIRTAEGYTLEESWFFQWTFRVETRRFERLAKEITKCNERIRKLDLLHTSLYLCGRLTPQLDQMLQAMRVDWVNRKRPLRERLELRFPSVRPKPLPTSLGNTIAAFEDYSWARYRIDAVHLWPRMLPILEDKGFTPFLQSEKAVFDFLLNMGLVIVGVCLELLLLFALHRPDWRYLLTILSLLIVAYLLYLGAVIAAQHWGGMVRVAFDLYRDDLRSALHLSSLPDEALDKERELWEAVSGFLVFGDDVSFRGFIYSQPQEAVDSKGGEPCVAANG